MVCEDKALVEAARDSEAQMKIEFNVPKKSITSGAQEWIETEALEAMGEGDSYQIITNDGKVITSDDITISKNERLERFGKSVFVDEAMRKLEIFKNEFEMIHVEIEHKIKNLPSLVILTEQDTKRWVEYLDRVALFLANNLFEGVCKAGVLDFIAYENKFRNMSTQSDYFIVPGCVNKVQSGLDISAKFPFDLVALNRKIFNLKGDFENNSVNFFALLSVQSWIGKFSAPTGGDSHFFCRCRRLHNFHDHSL